MPNAGLSCRSVTERIKRQMQGRAGYQRLLQRALNKLQQQTTTYHEYGPNRILQQTESAVYRLSVEHRGGLRSSQAGYVGSLTED